MIDAEVTAKFTISIPGDMEPGLAADMVVEDILEHMPREPRDLKVDVIPLPKAP